MPIRLRPERRAVSRNSPEDPEEFRAPLADHLEELRVRIIRIFALISAGMVAGWFLQPTVYGHLAELVRQMIPEHIDYKETFRNVTEPFMLKLRVSFYIGLILTFPFVVLQLWGFVKPGLKPSERRPLTTVAPLSVLLFLAGAAACWMIIPTAFAWFIGYIDEFPGTAIYQEPGTMIFFILKMMLAFGIGFQLPIVVYFLNKVGLLGHDTLRRYWRHATAAIFIGAAILTPSADIFSMLMMAVPMVLLFFVSLWAVNLGARRAPPEDDVDALEGEPA
jgi:sec-independent protein translocase protein TatC